MPSKKDKKRRRKAAKARAAQQEAEGRRQGVWIHRETGANYVGDYEGADYERVAEVRLVWPRGGGRQIVHQDDRARLPAGALAADSSRHMSVSIFDARPVYTTITQRCRTCGKVFVFSADEQRFWYEELQIPIQVGPGTCRACRRLERQAKAANQEMAEVLAALREHPDDPDAALAVAATTVRMRRAGGGGDLARAIGLARKAARSAAHASQAVQVLEDLYELRAETARG